MHLLKISWKRQSMLNYPACMNHQMWFSSWMSPCMGWCTVTHIWEKIDCRGSCTQWTGPMSILWPWNGSVDICLWLYLLWTRYQKDNAMNAWLTKKFDLTVNDTKDGETDVFALLWMVVQVNKNTGELTFLQNGLINKVLKATGIIPRLPLHVLHLLVLMQIDQDTSRHGIMPQWLECWCTWCQIVSLTFNILFTNVQGSPINQEQFISTQSYKSVITSWELKIRDLSADQMLNCYVDTDFDGLWKVENESNPMCVK